MKYHCVAEHYKILFFKNTTLKPDADMQGGTKATLRYLRRVFVSSW
jgi:hypothetical protein